MPATRPRKCACCARLQTDIIDRNRRIPCLLVRVQNDLNSLGLGMRDMLDARDGYPLTAWRSQFQRIRTDLEDAIAREADVAPPAALRNRPRIWPLPWRSSGMRSTASSTWPRSDEAEARGQVRLSLQARQAALSTAVSRLLVQNNESEEQAAARTQQIHAQVERNLYIFLARDAAADCRASALT